MTGDRARNEGGSSNDDRIVLGFLLTMFWRIMHRFSISNSAAAKLLAFISFLLGNYCMHT